MKLFYSGLSLCYCGCDDTSEVASVLGGLTFLRFEQFDVLSLVHPLFKNKEERKLSLILPSLFISHNQAG